MKDVESRRCPSLMGERLYFVVRRNSERNGIVKALATLVNLSLDSHPLLLVWLQPTDLLLFSLVTGPCALRSINQLCVHRRRGPIKILRPVKVEFSEAHQVITPEAPPYFKPIYIYMILDLLDQRQPDIEVAAARTN